MLPLRRCSRVPARLVSLAERPPGRTDLARRRAITLQVGSHKDVSGTRSVPLFPITAGQAARNGLCRPPDVTPELAKLKSEGAEVVLSAAQYNNQIQAVMSGMETLGWKAPVYFFPEAVTGDVHTQVPPSVSSQFHALMEAPVIDTGHQSKELTDFLEAANASGPVSYLFAMSLAYDAVWLAKWIYETAQKKSGDPSADSLKKAAESIGASDFDYPQLAFPPNPGWDAKTHTTANYDYSKFYGVIVDSPINNGQYKGKLLSAS